MAKTSRQSRFKKKSTSEQIKNEYKPEKPSIIVSPTEKTKWTDRPIYIIFTVFITIIAAVGGYPGIQQIWNNWNNKAELKFKPSSIGLFPKGRISSAQTILVFSGILFNSGQKDLLIDNQGFKLKIKFNNNLEIEGYTTYLPKDFKVSLKEATVNYNKIIDLQNTSKLSYGEPINGNIAFSLNEGADTTVPKIIREKPLFIISCTDISGKIYTASFNFNFKNKVTEDFRIPNLGVDIQSKKDSSILDSSEK